MHDKDIAALVERNEVGIHHSVLLLFKFLVQIERNYRTFAFFALLASDADRYDPALLIIAAAHALHER